MLSKSVQPKAHPAYTNPALPGAASRRAFEDKTDKWPGDTRKAVAKIYELAQLEDPPLRFALGKDCIATHRAKLVQLEENLGKYESWSEDLLREE